MQLSEDKLPQWKESYTTSGTGTCPICGRAKGALLLIHFGKCEECLPTDLVEQFWSVWNKNLGFEQLREALDKLKESTLEK
jgi:hypothetical protein